MLELKMKDFRMREQNESIPKHKGALIFSFDYYDKVEKENKRGLFMII